MCRYKRVNVEYEWSMDLRLQSWFHLHYAIPVVSSGNSEEQQKGHPKVFKCSVAPQTLTGVEFITNCRDKREVGGDKGQLLWTPTVYSHSQRVKENETKKDSSVHGFQLDFPIIK